MADEDHNRPPGAERNERTRVVSPAELGALTHPLSARAAFLVAHERLAVLASAATRPSIAVLAVDAQARVFDSRLLGDGAALIVGRHSQCGLQLPSSTVSLRHLAVLVQHERGRPMVQVRDLATGVPFLTEDGVRNAAVVADGPLYVSVAGYALWFVPVDADRPTATPEAAFAALGERTFVDRRAPEPPRPAPRAHRVTQPPPPGDAPEHSAVTSLGPPLLLGDGDEPEIGWGVLRIQHGQYREKRAVTAERLERGILLGRYERCGLVLSTAASTISRVHALLLRIGAAVWLVDTASTNGVFRAGAPVVAEQLRDDDSFTLSRSVTVEWHRTQHAEA